MKQATYDVVSNDIMVSILGEELDRVSTNITNSISTALLTPSGAQTEEQRSLLANTIKELGCRQVGDVVCNLKFTPCTSCFGVDDAADNELWIISIRRLTYRSGMRSRLK
jgi:hypothetical protein